MLGPSFHVLLVISRESYGMLHRFLSDLGRAFSSRGGLDLCLGDPLALRTLQLDYPRTTLGDEYLNNGCLSFGIVWRFGHQ
jgi:hypothetical protein